MKEWNKRIYRDQKGRVTKVEYRNHDPYNWFWAVLIIGAVIYFLGGC